MYFTTSLRYCIGSAVITLFFICSFTAKAQLVDVNACQGNLTRCVSEADTAYVMCFNVIPASICSYKKFTIKWGDNTPIETKSGPGPVRVEHTYKLGNFGRDCLYGGILKYNIEIETDCPGDNIIRKLVFLVKPSIRLAIPDACEAKPVFFRNNTCPNASDIANDTKYSWNFGDNTTSTLDNPTHTFPATQSSYTVSLTATNSCGTDAKQFTVPIKKTPVASYTAVGYDFKAQDTLGVCLSNGGVLSLDATTSIDASRYQWSITPNTYRYVQNTNSGSSVVKLQFTQTGNYTITLTALNDCGTSKPFVCQHRVIDLPPLTLLPQPDSCASFRYRLINPNPNATYTFNGQPLAPNADVEAALSPTPYIVRGELRNMCGTRVMSDTFFVQAPQAVRITTPNITTPDRKTAVCAASARFPLQTNLPNGTWSGSGRALIETQGTNTFFNPKTTGQYELIYSRGNGVCRRSDTIRIAVEGGQVTAYDTAICGNTTFVKLRSSLPGGVWRSTAFPNAVRNDTLFLNGITATQIPVSYELGIGTAGCPTRDDAVVSIGRPKADFSITGACSGSAVQIQNTSTAATTFRWFLNGQTNPISTDRQPTISLPAGQNRLLLQAGSGGCVDTISRAVRLVAALAPVSFTPSQTTGCSPMTVSFGVAGTANPDAQYSWNFSDGSTSTVFQPPVHTYQNQTRQVLTFPVSLTARNACGVQSYSAVVTVRPLVQADLGVDSTTFRCSPARVKFSNRSTGQSQPALWLFGDGSSPFHSSTDTLSHPFSARDSTQTFRVQLIAANECGYDTSRVSIRISPTLVRPLFTISNPTPCPGEPVTFTDATTPKPIRWIWRFSNGTVLTQANPQQAFTQPNTTYSVSLTAITECGYDSTRKSIRTGQLPTGDFQFKSQTACQGLPIQITNLTSPSNRFRWNFGDGSAIDSVTHSPTHSYTNPGSYTVTLTVLGASASCQNKFPKVVTIRQKPQATITVEGNAEQCAPGAIRLVGSAANADAWDWYVSDGRQLSGQTVTLPLSQPGPYSVSLVVSSGGADCQSSTGSQLVGTAISCEVFIPDAFSPNETDNIGRTWTLFGAGIQQIQHLRVRSRWGEVVFEKQNFPANSSQPGECWDGKFNGLPMPAGSYTFEAEVLMKGDTYVQRVGSVALLR
ncbi:PKD domain-containing protein [Spirosoma validum]|uniref:PKD domain-containing protein n=1 Tax=Spirosoma validum TaxID=2771355 RepID=A0A927B114_9BACT|nr:PKD domain-containing protein [Spirosoma validum]MBD2753282.1 PKD domain-containing protein [Spirosoma validum]